MDWQRHNNGHRWRTLADGRICIEGDGPARTEGPPLTMHTMLNDYGAAIMQAAEQFELNPALIMAIIGNESVREQPDWWRRDPQSYRREPPDVGDGNLQSGGLMQTLLKTARQVNAKFELYRKVDGELATVEMQDLFVAERSIMLGSGYLRMLADHDGKGWGAPAGECPVRLCAAYNAGGLYDSRKNRWRMRTFGRARIDEFVAWYNDALAVLKASIEVVA